MTPPRRRRPQGLGGIFREVRRTEKWGRHLSVHPVFRVWEEAVGEALARVTRPVDTKGETLWVEVSDPAWMQEVHLMREDLLAKLNEILGQDKLKEIRVRQGSGAPESVSRNVDRGGLSGYAVRSLPPDAVVTSEDEAAVQSLLDQFDNSDFRGSVERLIALTRKRRADVREKTNPANGKDK